MKKLLTLTLIVSSLCGSAQSSDSASVPGPSVDTLSTQCLVDTTQADTDTLVILYPKLNIKADPSLALVGVKLAQKYEYNKTWGFELDDRKASLILTFFGGVSDGVRDASMFRMDGRGKFMNGKQSHSNKYKNGNPWEGPAFWGSTDVFVFVTDLPHLANFVTHQINSFAIVLTPGLKDRSFWNVVKHAVAYNAIRQLGHWVAYDVAFKPR